MRNAGDVHSLQNNNQRMSQLTTQQSETADQASSLHSDESAVANLINICKHQHISMLCFLYTKVVHALDEWAICQQTITIPTPSIDPNKSNDTGMLDATNKSMWHSMTVIL